MSEKGSQLIKIAVSNKHLLGSLKYILQFIKSLASTQLILLEKTSIIIQEAEIFSENYILFNSRICYYHFFYFKNQTQWLKLSICSKQIIQLNKIIVFKGNPQ